MLLGHAESIIAEREHIALDGFADVLDRGFASIALRHAARKAQALDNPEPVLAGIEKDLSQAQGIPSGTSAGHLLVELLQRDSGSWILIQGCVPGQGLGDAIVVVLEDGRQRLQEVSGKDGPLCLRKVKRQFLHVCDGGHDVDSSEFGHRGKRHSETSMSGDLIWRVGWLPSACGAPGSMARI